MVHKHGVGAPSVHAHIHVQWLAMLLVNFLQLLFLLDKLFPENKGMEPIKRSIFICMQDDIGEQEFTFFAKGQKPIFTPY